jgi:hypothetical protein
MRRTIDAFAPSSSSKKFAMETWAFHDVGTRRYIFRGSTILDKAHSIQPFILSPLEVPTKESVDCSRQKLPPPKPPPVLTARCRNDRQATCRLVLDDAKMRTASSSAPKGTNLRCGIAFPSPIYSVPADTGTLDLSLEDLRPLVDDTPPDLGILLASDEAQGVIAAS